MTPIPLQSKLTIQSQSATIALHTLGLTGIPSGKITLHPPDGRWTIECPTSAFPGVVLNPGEPAYISLTITRVAIEAVEDGQAIQPSALILPKAN